MASPVVIPTVTGQWREFWVFYRRYTDTTIHTASTVVLAIFGILVFLDPWFAALAIGSYVLPPVVLYILAEDPVPGTDEGYPRHDRSTDRTDRTLESATAGSNTNRSGGGHHSRTGTTARPDTAVETGTGGTDSDSDSDSDSDDGDTDSDSDGTDTDTDSDGTDTDTDSDDGDTDSDSDG